MKVSKISHLHFMIIVQRTYITYLRKVLTFISNLPSGLNRTLARTLAMHSSR